MIAPTTLAVAETLNAAKMYGSARGNLTRQSVLQLRGRVGAHQLELAGIGGVEAAQRVDRDREEGEEGG